MIGAVSARVLGALAAVGMAASPATVAQDVTSFGGGDGASHAALEALSPEKPPRGGPTTHLSDLSIGNFLTVGFDQDWEKWRHYTPDMALLRVTTNFLERELRADYAKTDVANSAATDSTDFVNVLMAYALNYAATATKNDISDEWNPSGWDALDGCVRPPGSTFARAGGRQCRACASSSRDW